MIHQIHKLLEQLKLIPWQNMEAQKIAFFYWLEFRAQGLVSIHGLNKLVGFPSMSWIYDQQLEKAGYSSSRKETQMIHNSNTIDESSGRESSSSLFGQSAQVQKTNKKLKEKGK